MEDKFILDPSTIFTYPAGEMKASKSLLDLEGKVYAFYYPWYHSPNGTSNEWDHWTNVTEDSIYDSANYPLHGAYDSSDENVIRSHFSIMKQAGIDGVIVSWWGAYGPEAWALDSIFNLALEYNLDVSLYYESVRDLSQSEIIDELVYIFEEYSDYPAFMKNEGIPVVFVYAVPAFSRDPSFWVEVREQVDLLFGDHILLGETANLEYMDAFDGFHVYIQLGENMPEFYRRRALAFGKGTPVMSDEEAFEKAFNGENIDLVIKPFMLTASPGFDTTSWGRYEPYVDRLDGDSYRDYWMVINCVSPHCVLITSWNEWHEGTEIEPSIEHGFRYVDFTREYIEEYKKQSFSLLDVTYSAKLEDIEYFTNGTGYANLVIEAIKGDALYVNISVWGNDFESIQLEYDSYVYFRRTRDDFESIIIPSIGEGNELDVEVFFKTHRDDPELSITVLALDPSGNSYQLYDDSHSLTVEDIQSSSEDTSEPIIPGFSVLSIFLALITVYIVLSQLKLKP
jgi:hypothetical protein